MSACCISTPEGTPDEAEGRREWDRDFKTFNLNFSRFLWSKRPEKSDEIQATVICDK